MIQNVIEMYSDIRYAMNAFHRSYTQLFGSLSSQGIFIYFWQKFIEPSRPYIILLFMWMNDDDII